MQKRETKFFLNSPFNNDNYNTLLEGLDVSISNYKNIREFIIGSEFYSTKKLKALSKISSEFQVSDFFELKSDIVSNISNVLSYDLTHSLGNFLHDIELTEFIETSRKKAKVGDFIISRLRSYLKEFAVVEERLKEQVFSSEYLIYRPLTDKISSNTLVAFCLTDEVQTILNCSQYGTAHPRFYEFVFNELPLPKVLFNLNSSINKLFEKAFLLRSQAVSIYTQAEQFLLKTINLVDFEPSKDPINIKNLENSFLQSGRLDAEFYQKKYDDLLDIITKQPFKQIRDIREDNFRGLQPIYTENGNLDVINSKHILEKSLDYLNFEKTDFEYWEKQQRARVFAGDILTYTTGANIGRTQVYNSSKKALASNHVNIIRLKQENPFYIGFVLNSLVGRMQTEKRSAGSAQAELYPKDLDEFLIPIISTDKQETIIKLIEDSFNLKAESERLLEVAKKTIEMGIEENEQNAIDFINQFN